jgi:hypothetical protein
MSPQYCRWSSLLLPALHLQTCGVWRLSPIPIAQFVQDESAQSGWCV